MDRRLQNYADLGKDLMKQDGLWDDALKGLDEKQLPSSPKPSSRKWVVLGLAILAALIVCTLIYSKQNKVEPIPMAYYEAIPTSLVPNVRVSEGDSKTNLERAVIAYGDKDFDEAEILLIPLAKNDNNDLAKLYLASIYLGKEKYKEATTLLSKIQNSDLNDYVQWNKALGLLPLDSEKAKTLLLEIANDKAHFRSEKSKEILQRLQ